MDKDTKGLMIFGGIILGGWLLYKLIKDGKYSKCPRCNYPLHDNQNPCPNCGQLIFWDDKK